jgi:hypothetical protein
MTRLFTGFLLLWFGFSYAIWSHLMAEGKQISVDGFSFEIPATEEVVAHAVADLGEASQGHPSKLIELLTRDIDYLVKTYTFRIQVGSSTGELLGPFFEGYAIDLPSGFQLESGQVPVRLVRSSCLNGPVYSAVVGLGFDRTDPLRHVCYSLYVFKGTQLLFHRLQAGLKLEQFVFRDLDEDCLPEMIDVNRSNNGVTVTVRAMKADGSMEEVQKLTGATADIGFGEGVETDMKYPNPDALCFVTGFVGTWNRQLKKFVGKQRE